MSNSKLFRYSAPYFSLFILLILSACSTQPHSYLEQGLPHIPTLRLLLQIEIVETEKPSQHIQAVIDATPQSWKIVFLSNTGRRIASYSHARERPNDSEWSSSRDLPQQQLQPLVEAIQLTLLPRKSANIDTQAQSQQWKINDKALSRKVYYQSQEYAEIVYTSAQRESGEMTYKSAHSAHTMTIRSTPL